MKWQTRSYWPLVALALACGKTNDKGSSADASGASSGGASSGGISSGGTSSGGASSGGTASGGTGGAAEAAISDAGGTTTTTSSGGMGGAAGACDGAQDECGAACVSGQYRCQGAFLEHCNAGGTAFERVEQCQTPSLCDEVAGACREPACSADEYRCQENVLEVCLEGLDGFGVSEVCGASESCTTTPPGCDSFENFVPGLDGRLIDQPCWDLPTTDDCNSGGFRINGANLNYCSAGYSELDESFEVGGQPGALYDMTLHFYGILEPKSYGVGVEREATNRPSLLEGGTPTPWAEAAPGHTVPSSNYNSHEIHVHDENEEEVAVYYLNADIYEEHVTFAINYEKTIPVVGGGRIRLRHFDVNCRIVKNCGTEPGFPCSPKVRVIDISSADPQPDDFDQPCLGQNNDDDCGQWLLIDVTGIVPR